MTGAEVLLEVLRIIAAISVPYIALLRTRADIDRIAAKMRAKESGEPFETQVRRRWYHRLKPMRKLK